MGCLYSFRHNTQTWQTDRPTDNERHHRPRCAASRSKNKFCRRNSAKIRLVKIACLANETCLTRNNWSFGHLHLPTAATSTTTYLQIIYIYYYAMINNKCFSLFFFCINCGYTSAEFSCKGLCSLISAKSQLNFRVCA